MSSRSINKVMLLGNLTRDPLVKFTSAGTAVATFSIATNRSWTTAEGQVKEDVQYHNIVAWAKLAELVGKLLSKGKKVYEDKESDKCMSCADMSGNRAFRMWKNRSSI